MGLLGGGGIPGQLAICQQLKPAHLPRLEQAPGLLAELQPTLPQDCYKLTLHLQPSISITPRFHIIREGLTAVYEKLFGSQPKRAKALLMEFRVLELY